MNDFESFLNERLARQITIVSLNEESPDDVKADKIWLLTQSYNVGILHSIRIIQDAYHEYLAKLKANEQQQPDIPNKDDLK